MNFEIQMSPFNPYWVEFYNGQWILVMVKSDFCLDFSEKVLIQFADTF